MGHSLSKPVHSLPVLRDRLGDLDRSAPLASLFKAIIDPFVVVLVLFALARPFEIAQHGMLPILAAIAFALSALFLDGTFLLMPDAPGRFLGVGRLVVCWVALILVLWCLGALSGLLNYFPPEFLLAWVALSPVALLLVHGAIRSVVLNPVRSKLGLHKVVIVGATESGAALADRIRSNPQLKMDFVGYFDDREVERLDDVAAHEMLGRIADLHHYVQANGVRQIFISLPMTSQPRVMALLEALQDCTASIYFLPDLFIFDMIQACIDDVAGFPVVGICESPFVGIDGVVKRASDIVLSLMILAVIWPVMLALAVAVKLSSPGPALFRQHRYGANGENILVYKFRSMTVMEDGDSVQQATRSDSRLTPIGAFIRKTSLDELPQFINVLQGRMSIVGPRPHANAHNEMYRKLIKGYMLRHKVRPGITGWAQVNGYRGETDTVDKMQRRIEYDLDYLRNWSIWFDLKIIALTVWTVLRGHNAY
ncbi:undecaprenyl-phosphate glucose phosphotransferase [Paludibacterium yongneupense]|uniref:undecaprenyl-phosphate glucose phosphotransferase n=1 Tax=Paludibacterium yongneupense TaxID=400061 RepID=UPI000410883E|nr:undecaprenyl-phosphate glucose phosphotransferase [Paludibacterium yongneupense]